MKKVIIIFILITSQNLFSQEYFFDSYYEYTSDKSVVFFMINSKDSSYAFYGVDNNNDLSGYIYDFLNSKIHYYKVINNAKTVDFTYFNSKKIDTLKTEHLISKYKLVNEYQIKKIDSLKESIKIFKFWEGKKKIKEKIAEIDLVYDSNDSKYIFHDAVLNYFSQSFFGYNKIINLNNRLPRSYTFNDYNVFKFSMNLSSIKKIDTKLTIKSKDLIYIK